MAHTRHRVYVGILTEFPHPARGTSRFRSVVWLAAALSLPGSATAAATFRGENGRIAFVREGRLFTIKPNSTGLRLLTPSTSERSLPTWSADGSRIAFLRYTRRGSAVLVVRADGSKLRRLSGFTRGFLSPAAWRPGGRQVVYHDVLADETPVVGAVKLANADGSGERNLTGYGDLNANPDWSPTGRQIVFERDAGGIPGGPPGQADSEIWRMQADGSAATRLTHNDVLDDGPAWSPDGRRIAFARTVEGGPDGDLGADLWIMNSDGSSQTQLTTSTGFVKQPQWSPNGRRILFVRIHPDRPNAHLFTLKSDGSDLKRIATMRTHTAPIDATWSPDSRRVLMRTPKGVLRIARADGSNARTLTRGGVIGMDWQAR
jgi:Tol biopolymer transport system component